MATPPQLIEDCRQRYNAEGDKFFSDQELFDLVYDASLELATETECIERVYSLTTTAGTREYSFPDLAYKVHRIQWKGERLDPIDFMQDDFHTGNDFNTTEQGDPRYYAIYNYVLYLRPTPDAAETLKIFTVDFPDTVSNTSTLDLPRHYHSYLKDYVLQAMFAKDGNQNMASYHRGLWENAVTKVKRVEMKRKISDQYPVVKMQEQMPIHDVDHIYG